MEAGRSPVFPSGAIRMAAPPRNLEAEPSDAGRVSRSNRGRARGEFVESVDLQETVDASEIWTVLLELVGAPPLPAGKRAGLKRLKKELESLE